MEQPVDQHNQSGEGVEGRHEPILDTGLDQMQPSAERHPQEQLHIGESAVSQKKALASQNAPESIGPGKREKRWEVSFQEGLFHLDQVQRYSSLEEVNEAIEKEKRKLTELSQHSQEKQEPISIPAEAANEGEPAASNQLNEQAAEYQQQSVPMSLKEKVEGSHIIPMQQLGQARRKQEQPQQDIQQQESRVEYLYKPVDDRPQQAIHESKQPVVEEAAYNEAIQRSSQFERRNSELEQRCKELEQQVAELTSRLAQSQSKLQEQENQPDASVEIVEPNGTEANRTSPTASVKKKINDDGLKKILYAMESADKGIAIPIELPKRKKLSRKGPLFSRDFKLASNVYNIAFGEIMDLDHTWAKEEQQLLRQEEKVRAETERKFAQVLPDINVFQPSRNTMRENWQTQTELEQGTLEQLQRKRFQLESELQNINEQIRNDGFDGKATPARYNSASDWKDHHKHGTETEAQGYSSNNPEAMYWHSLGKKSALQLERSEAAIRSKHSMEDREDNPQLYPKRMSKHRSRPVSKKKKSAEELEPSRDMLRDLRDKNQQDNEDKAIQTPEIILSPGFKVTLKDLVFPMLPGKPENYHTPKQLSELARKTYTALGVPIDESNSLQVKKFKNCVWFKVFDISIVWYYEGKFYIGGWKESGFTNQGEKEGHGIQLIPNKYLYEGSFEQGRRHGHGKIKYENGDYYEGEWNNGVKEGTGRLVQANGIVYEGQMRDGRRDGYGKLTVTPLEVYEGGFVRGIKNGRGKESFKTGDHYEGDYVLGKFSGQGCYKWANGAMYKGRFHNGCRSGKGYWRSAASIPCDTYDGEYQNDKKCGRGVYTWENGVSYDGQFMNDLRQGQGIVRYPNGKVIRAMWENGTRKQQLFSEQKELYKQARKRAESASAKASMLPKVS